MRPDIVPEPAGGPPAGRQAPLHAIKSSKINRSQSVLVAARRAFPYNTAPQAKGVRLTERRTQSLGRVK
jgi:hypothetical protein